MLNAELKNVGPSIASAATIRPWAKVTPVSGTEAITQITPPFAGFEGQLILLPTGAWTTATTTVAGNNILTAITATSNVPVIAVFSGGFVYLK